MGTLKKYNEKTGIWEVISTSDASVIGVRSEKLLPEGIEKTNIEEVLINMQDSINTLEGNVSWLATYGGGGGSGGGGVSGISGSITVNGYNSGNTIPLDDTLNILVQSSSAGASWEVSVVADNKVVKTVISNKITITKEDLNKEGITKTFQLQITAYNADTLTNIYWNGTVQIATIHLTSETVNYSFSELSKYNVLINYEIGILGTYWLVIGGSEIWRGNLTANTGYVEVPLDSIKDLLNVGENKIEARLHLDEQVYGVVTLSIILTAETPIIVCNTLQEDIDNPVVINIGNNTIIQTPYTVYYSGGTYKVRIYKEGDTVEYSNTYNSYNVQYNNASYVLYSENYNQEYTLHIEILDSASNYSYKKSYKIITSEPQYNLLDNGLQEQTIFDFITYTGFINNGCWQDSHGHELLIYNSNIYSQSIQTSDKSLRLQNAAYATIKNKNKGSLISSGFTEFSIIICYKADFHPDDDRTILQFGNTDNENNPLQGIFLKVHSLHIGQNKLDLQDNELINLTITYQRSGNSGKAFVYIDGVIERVYSIDSQNIYPGNNTIYIGAQENEIYFTDTTIYRVSLFNKCLNPYQVLFETLNDRARTHLLSSGLPDIDYIQDGLKRNFIDVDENGNTESLLWDTSKQFNNNLTDFSNLFTLSKLVSITENNISFRSDIQQYSIPIPIMIIDVSQSWTWENFITPKAQLEPLTGCRMEYYDQTQNNGIINKISSVGVSLQGTSTLADFIKNLNLEFPDNCVFIPKPTWLPEKTYTLKADIVDSSHALNTSIGKFVNEQLGYTYTEKGDIDSSSSWYPYSEQVANTFKEAKNTNVMKNYFPKATLKHGVEGFPVFLIMRFKKDKEESKEIVTLGIYQFILGRDSSRNLGYEIITQVNGMEENPTYPYYKDDVTITTSKNEGYWLEMIENEAFPNDLNFQQLDSITDQQLTGAFWQKDPNYLNRSVEIKYSNLGENNVTNVSDFAPFMEFVESVIALPVTNRRSSEEGGNVLVKHTFSNTTYPKYVYESKDGVSTWKKTNDHNIIVNRGDDLEQCLKKLNIESISKFFVIAMLFGLLDNFQKNLPLKFYKKQDGSWENAILGIYDTDSGCGGNNQADLNIPESLWLCGFDNINKQMIEVPGNQNQNVIGNSNKLWYLDSEDVNYSLNIGANGSIYTNQWNSLLNLFNTKWNGLTNLNQIVDLFMNEYFIPQTLQCGELVFNLTYFSKYLNKYEQGSSFVNQQDKLQGRRVYQIRKWLYNRVKFLDSLFGAMGTTSGAANKVQLSPQSVNITSGSFPDFYLTTNYPMILNVNHQGNTPRYVFCDGNVEENVYWGHDQGQTVGVSHTISYSDSIKTLGNEQVKLADIQYQKLANSLPYLTILDLSNCSSLTPMNSEGMNSFKTNGKSELRIINCSNTAKTTKPIEYILSLDSGFDKLQEINIQNSCVSQLSLPINPNIPLRVLNIKGSQLTYLNLDNQNLINSLDLEGCNKLINLKITNCALLKTLKLNETQSNLTEIEIASDSFENFECISNKKVKNISITSTSLSQVVIKGCTNLESLTVSGNVLKHLELSECTKLNTLNITSPSDSIDVLHLDYTKLNTIQYNGTNSNLMDLSRFKSIGSFKINNNTEVVKIQFNNDIDNPIHIINNFIGCSNLERVYGNIYIECSKTFQNCSKFSILGTDCTTYLGNSIIYNENIIKHPTEIPNITENSKMKFQEGPEVTNLTFNTEDINSCFYGTSCTTFDVYYALYNIGTATNLSSMFRSLKTKIFDLTNNPHRNTFINCSNVTSLERCFQASTGDIILFSPTHDGDTVLEDNGLFSPLINCTNINILFYDSILYVDRFTFRRKINNYKFEKITHFFKVYNIFENVNDIESIDNLDQNIAGNFEDYFAQCPLLKDINGFAGNTIYVNYDTINRLIPQNVLTVRKVLVSQYGTGSLIPSNLFSNPSNVIGIYNSFIIKSNDHGSVTFNINSETLEKFTNLEEISYSESGDFVEKISPFNGSGILKQIDQNEFPYKILDSCKNTIKVFRGFFQNVSSEIISKVSIPGDLFIETRNITHCDYLFKDFNIQYELTSNSFENCPNLTSVSYMFANDKISNINGFIPSKLFYHGQIEYPEQVIQYLKEEELSFDPTEPIKDNDGNYMLDGNGNYIYPTVEKDLILEKTIDAYEIPRNNITSMKGCFMNCNASAYINDNPTLEHNVNYFPGDYYKDGDRWVKKEKNENESTNAWEFDGVNNLQGESYDDEHDLNSIPQIKLWNDSTTGTLNYMCAPDLLRYCRKTADVSELFAESGHNSNSLLSQTNHADDPTYGIKGRIPPYLLKPVESITSIYKMFSNCKQLSYYTQDDGKQYIIPKSFFNYTKSLTNLKEAFSGLVFPNKIDLNVFSNSAIRNRVLSLEKVFYNPLFITDVNSRVVINNIFPMQVATLYRAFSVNSSDSQADALNNMIRSQYVTFNGVFNSNKIAVGADTYVFDGYDNDTVKFTESETLREGYNNYRTV